MLALGQRRGCLGLLQRSRGLCSSGLCVGLLSLALELASHPPRALESLAGTGRGGQRELLGGKGTLGVSMDVYVS